MAVSPGTVIRTLQNLRLRQVGHQVLRRLRKRSGSPLPLAWRRIPPRVGREKNTRRAYFDGRDGFRFNNETRVFRGDWNDPAAPKLWKYNLHYMGWLFDLGEASREAWIERWIRDNPPCAGDGWEPYPVSLRLFHWCKHYSLSGRVPPETVLGSLRSQGGWLLANLEFHLDGNHLLENLLALRLLAFFLDPGDTRAPGIAGRIDSLLANALSDQYLPDGGHYELSPMYHAILLERMLDLLNLWPEGESPVLRSLVERLSRLGLDWLETMSVGGEFSLFNDSCYDAAPEAAALLEYGTLLLGRARPPASPLRRLPASGYYRAEIRPFTLIFDAGNLGPDHQLGHAQGDMLSFALWLEDKPVLVNPGNYGYVPGEMRAYCRATASHNTVALRGSEQGEWWASHRVGRRGRVLDACASFDDSTLRATLEAAHDAFRAPPPATVHSRRIGMDATGIVIEDRLSAPAARQATAYFHFHPDCEVRREGDAVVVSVSGGPGLELLSEGALRLEEGWHCPEFGLRIRSRVAAADFTGGCRSILRRVDDR